MVDKKKDKKNTKKKTKKQVKKVIPTSSLNYMRNEKLKPTKGLDWMVVNNMYPPSTNQNQIPSPFNLANEIQDIKNQIGSLNINQQKNINGNDIKPVENLHIKSNREKVEHWRNNQTGSIHSFMTPSIGSSYKSYSTYQSANSFQPPSIPDYNSDNSSVIFRDVEPILSNISAPSVTSNSITHDTNVYNDYIPLKPSKRGPGRPPNTYVPRDPTPKFLKGRKPTK